MNTTNINGIALAISLAFSTGAMADTLSKHDYQASKNEIAAKYKLEKSACASLSGNANDICEAAAGNERTARAELENSYKPSSENRYKARVAKAETDYAVANERCDDKAGNTKDICVKEAKAVETGVKVDAKAQMKTWNANDKASDKAADAYQAAEADKLEAQYKVAKEKCDTFAGNVKDVCMSNAKARFRKS